MKNITFATTTSVQDSGLLASLLPAFEQQSGYRVKVLSVGSGLAIDMAKEGKVDLILVHQPEAEQELVTQGVGINRQLIMHNDFILVGPGHDPAGIRGTGSAIPALQKIAAKNSVFISRGDASGTDKKEKELWQKAGLELHRINYQPAKSGMGETLAVASAKKGYTLTDRATYLANKQDLELEIMVEGDPLLLNVYHVIQVNPDRFPQVNAAGAKELVNYLLSNQAQQTIGAFLKDKYRQGLFVPDAGKTLAEITGENSRPKQATL